MSKPRKVTIASLEAVFSKEQLSRSSAKGVKENVHNFRQRFKVVVEAIKKIALTCFKKDKWRNMFNKPLSSMM